ncbi:GEM-like protein 1 [Prosopis cineraria]|uniref:GEM-like protein 1 n=1 Tax=Prosopis cineraria TaxID=364024 RepID=UPI0024108A24|nr:GEM-like protein 1 [Prosopis cineraria]
MAAHSNNINSNNQNPYINVTPIPNSPANNKSSNPMNTIYGVLNRCGKTVEKATKQAEDMADNFWKHIRLGSNPADAAMARLFQGTKVLTYGGYDIVFENTFGIMQGEKLLKQYACYISTSNGPIIGTLYISTKRLAFCSDYALYYYPVSPHNSQPIYYKVVVPIEQLSRVSPCSSRWNPSEKYIEVVTVDGFEFTFMGFIAYNKALNTLSEALQRCRTHSTGD